MRTKLVVATLLATACVGCSTELRGWRGADIPTSKTEGAYQLYFLPQLELKLTITRKLRKCGTLGRMPNEPTVVETTVELEPTYVADESRPIAIDYEKLDRPISQISLSVERYDNKTLKSINASVQDKTAQVSSNILSGVATIAKAAMGLGVTSSSVCYGGIEEDVALRDNLVRNVAALERKLASVLAPSDGNPSDPYTDEQKKLIKEIKGQIKDLKDSLEPIAERLTIKDTQTWKPAGFADSPKALGPSDAVFKKWFQPGSQRDLGAALSVYVSIEGVSGKISNIGDTKNTSALIYRDPARARVRVCAESACPSTPTETSAILLSKDVDFPQGGVDVPLRLHNSPFDDTTLAATFSTSGALLTFKYESAAELERMSAAFKEGANSTAGVLDAADKEKKK